jgi:type IX secretion system PorP/SprF family membrane protein
MKIIGIFLLSILCSYKLNAQDAHLSMYDAAPLFLNPSLTGILDGEYRLHAHYRTQWKSVNFKPYTSILASFDMPIKKWSFGIQANNFRAGFGNFNVFQGLLSTSYSTAIDKSKNHMLSFGIQAGAMQKSVEYQLLSFNNQYNLNNGGDFDMSIADGEDFGGQSVIIPVANAGGMYYYAKEKARFNPFIGFSGFNLLESKESLFGANNRLPFRSYLHLGSRINITEFFYIIPKILIMNQREFREQTYAAEVGYYLKTPETFLLAGFIFRNRDATVLTFGVKKENFILRLAYDINVSTLNNASSGRGGFEISLTYVYKSKEKKDPHEKICPRL